MDCNPPGSSVHRILQARILEWVAISFSKGCSDAAMLSKKIIIHPVPQREGTVLTPRKRLVYNTPLPCPPRPLPLPLPLSPSSLFWFQFIKIWATLSLAPSTSTSVCISSSLLHHLLYPDGVTLQAGWIYYSFPPPPRPPPGYQTQPSAGRSLSRSTDKDVGWTEEVLGEANKYIKLPAGSGDKGSGDGPRHRCISSRFPACPRR